jgi:hypothetical protein
MAQIGWKDPQGKVVPDTDDRKSVNGFGAWVLVTADSDWATKWNTPSDVVPHFTDVKSLARGQHAFVLIFFANPSVSRSGEADITCDIDVTRPNGTQSAHVVDQPCFKRVIRGKLYSTRLCAPYLDFVGDPNDPSGRWVVRVAVKDNQRHATVRLKTSFILR